MINKNPRQLNFVVTVKAILVDIFQYSSGLRLVCIHFFQQFHFLYYLYYFIYLLFINIILFPILNNILCLYFININRVTSFVIYPNSLKSNNFIQRNRYETKN